MFRCAILGMTRNSAEFHPDRLAYRVARRWTMSFKYQPKEKKRSKVERLMKVLREQTGISRNMAEDIADAIVRGRDTDSLARQKGWPVENGVINGPDGELSVSNLRSQAE